MQDSDENDREYADAVFALTGWADDCSGEWKRRVDYIDLEEAIDVISGELAECGTVHDASLEAARLLWKALYPDAGITPERGSPVHHLAEAIVFAGWLLARYGDD